MAEAKPLALKQDLQPPVWLYANVEVPSTLAGYSVAGSRVALDLSIGANNGILITAFVNGNMVSRGDQNSQVPIALTQSAQPGQKLLIAVRILSSGTVGCCGGPSVTRLESASLVFTPPGPRPDPAIVRQEIMAAQLLIAAYPDGKARAPAATRRRCESHRPRRARPGRPGTRSTPRSRPRRPSSTPCAPT